MVLRIMARAVDFTTGVDATGMTIGGITGDGLTTGVACSAQRCWSILEKKS